MIQFRRSPNRLSRRRHGGRVLSIEPLEARCVLSTSYISHNLVSDQAGIAPLQDPSLVNAWGIALSPSTGNFWIADNGKDLATVYGGDVAGSPLTKNSLEVTIPGGAPTGQVFNSTTSDFNVTDGTNTDQALFIFASEAGDVTGWSPNVPPSSTAAQSAFQTSDGAVYKGIALAADNGDNFLYVADFHNRKIDVLNSSFDLTTLGGNFTDPNLPTGFAPFNVAAINDQLYVTYAKQDSAAHDDVKGAGNGFIDVFTTDGAFVKRLVSQGKLNSPWGMVVAPSNFGDFSNDLLVGNFGDGKINAYDATTGDFKGTLASSPKHPVVIDGLWGLAFGNGATAGDANTLYFTAGPKDESHGLFGKITANAAGTSAVTATLFDGVLTVEGTPGGNNIKVQASHGHIQVTAGGHQIGSFDPSSVNTVEVFGLGGNDTITVAPSVHATTLVDGGAGNDKIFGGGGPNILLGGPGGDQLFGSANRDILIGGTGRDTLFGFRNDDILIGGATTHDTDPTALLAIMGEWNSSDSFATRQQDLQTGANSLPILNSSTVTDDHTRDILIGRPGHDWRFKGSGDISD